MHFRVVILAPQLFLHLVHETPHRCYRKTESWIQILVLRVQTDKTQNILFLAISREKVSSEAHTLPRGRSQFPQHPLQLRIAHSKTEDPRLSSNAAPGFVGRGHVQRSQVSCSERSNPTCALGALPATSPYVLLPHCHVDTPDKSHRPFS